jgi:hypothetical protein
MCVFRQNPWITPHFVPQRQSSKELCDVITDRAIWSLVLYDIMEVIPLPSIRHSISSMSADELIQKAILITRIDEVFRQEVINPTNITRHPLDHIAKVEVGPGGQWMLLQSMDCTLHLYNSNLEDPPFVTAKLPENVPIRQPLPRCMALLLTTSGGEHLALASDNHTSLEYASS